MIRSTLTVTSTRSLTIASYLALSLSGVSHGHTMPIPTEDSLGVVDVLGELDVEVGSESEVNAESLTTVVKRVDNCLKADLDLSLGGSWGDVGNGVLEMVST